MKTRMERFLAKTERDGDCLIWIGAKNTDGTGQFWNGSKLVSAHRWLYGYDRLEEGEPLGQVCGRIDCVEVSHQQPGLRRPPKHTPSQPSLRPALERFAEMVDLNWDTGCWEWTGYLNYKGYGFFNLDGKNRGAHRVAWELQAGEAVPEGLEVDHLCYVPRCVNPDHLEAVTPEENLRRALERRRETRPLKQSCKYGHEDYVRRPNGKRECRECKRQRAIEYQARKKAEAPPKPPRQPKQVCNYGHEDYVTYPSGLRVCRECKRRYQLVWKAKKRAEAA